MTGGGSTPVSRRSALWMGVLGTVAASGGIALIDEMASARTTAGPAAANATSPAGAVAGAGPRSISASASATAKAAATSPQHAPAPPPPPWARRWHKPIYSIDDFTQRCPTERFATKAVMLTIDDGPTSQWTPHYLKLLDQYKVTATFCMIGEQVHPNRALAREIVDHGHVIANHTWTHDEGLPYRSAADIHSEIQRTSDAIHKATGYVPSQFRAPGGVWGPKVFAELEQAQLMPLGWDIDPNDWKRPGRVAIQNSMLEAGDHDIILCHDGGGDRSQTYGALTRVIPNLLQRGYKFVTLPAPQPHA